MPRILLIDDDDVFAAQFALYAELSDWAQARVDGQSTVLLPEKLYPAPDLVIMDYHLNGCVTAQDWLDELDRAGYCGKILLLTGAEQTLEIQHTHLEKAFKPFELSKLPRYFPSRDTPQTQAQLATVTRETSSVPPKIPQHILNLLSSELPLALSVHHISVGGRYAEPEWHNKYYSNNPLDQTSKRHLMSLVYTLQNNQEKTARRTDWDNKKRQWLHLRLYALPYNRYWFSREWGGENGESPNFFHTAKGLSAFLAELAVSLRNWGITRLRFYHAHDFFDDAAYKGNPERDYLLAPYFQRGDGFIGNTTEEEWKKHWIRLDNYNPFNLPACHWYSAELKTNNNRPEKQDACKELGWGAMGVTRVEVPISTTRERPLGLLTFDRRYDHIDGAQDATKYAWLKPYIDRAGDDTPFSKISHDEIVTMTGFMGHVIGELRERCEQLRRDQLRKLHEEISNGIQKATQKTASPSGSIKQILTHLMAQWANIDGYEGENAVKTKYQRKAKGILAWYFVKREEVGGLRGLGGYGNIADKIEGVLLPDVPLTDTVFNSPSTKDRGYTVQTFQDWLKEHPNAWLPNTLAIHNESQNIEADNQAIQSWFALPVDTSDQHYLMIIHAGRKNYFTTRRTKLFKSVALRMRPFLLWLVAEESRTWFYRSLSHELRAPLDAALQYANAIPNGDKLPDYVRYMRSLIDNVSHLNQPNALNERDRQKTTTLREGWDIKAMLETLYSTKAIVIHSAFDDEILAVPSAVLRQVLFNLLGNACKFAYQRSPAPIQATVRKKENQLLCAIRNPIRADERMTAAELKLIFNPNFRASNVGTTSGSGIGLSVVRNLCQQTKMDCRPEMPAQENGIWYQTFTLSIPLEEK